MTNDQIKTAAILYCERNGLNPDDKFGNFGRLALGTLDHPNQLQLATERIIRRLEERSVDEAIDSVLRLDADAAAIILEAALLKPKDATQQA